MSGPEGNKESGKSILRGTFTEAEIESLQGAWSKITAPARRRAERAENRRAEKQAVSDEISRRKAEKAMLKAENRENRKKESFCTCKGVCVAGCGVLAIGTCALVTVGGPAAVRAIEAVIRSIKP